MGGFLLDEWLLKACFKELNFEGLTKQYNLKPEFAKNMLLADHIVHSVMTLEEWEVPTPSHERMLGQTPDKDLFRTSDQTKKEWRDKTL